MPEIVNIEPISDTNMHENEAMGMRMRAKISNIFGPISDPVGDYSFAYIMTKRGSRMC